MFSWFIMATFGTFVLFHTLALWVLSMRLLSLGILSIGDFILCVPPTWHNVHSHGSGQCWRSPRKTTHFILCSRLTTAASIELAPIVSQKVRWRSEHVKGTCTCHLIFAICPWGLWLLGPFCPTLVMLAVYVIMCNMICIVCYEVSPAMHELLHCMLPTWIGFFCIKLPNSHGGVQHSLNTYTARPVCWREWISWQLL